MPDAVDASPTKPGIHRISDDTLLVIEFLLESEVGRIVSYRDLTRLLGRSVESTTCCLKTAMHILLRDHGVLFENVRTKGYRRIETVEGSIKAGPVARKKIGRTVNRAKARIICATKANDVPEEIRMKLNAEVTVLGTIYMLSRPSFVKKAEPQAQNGSSKVDARKMLAMFAA